MSPPFLISHIITGLSDGGAEAVLYRLCTHDLDNEHHVISMMDMGKYGQLLCDAGIRVDCLNMPPGRITVKGLLQLRKLLKSKRPDVVQTWMYHADLVGGLMARISGIRSICWGVRQSNLNRGICKTSTIWVAKLCAVFSWIVPRKIVCCANSAALVHQNLGYCAHKFVIIPNGYKLDHFFPDEVARKLTRNELGIEGKQPLLGMVARFDAQKDHKNLLQALYLAKKSGYSFHCVLVGKGMSQDNAQMVKWIEEFGISENVFLIGQRNNIPAIMNALDVHVLSSLGEAFPNVLAEAMSSGTPCVTTNVGDASLIVGDTGWVVPPKDPMALSQSISFALNALGDEQTWSHRQRMARHRIIQKFSLERMVCTYQSVWNDVVEH